MSDSRGISRRDFFGAAGMTAGGLAALGSTLPMLGGSAGAQAALASYSSGARLALELDGVFAGFLTQAQGGGFVSEFFNAPRGAAATGLALSGVARVPLTIIFGTGMTANALEWLAARDMTRRSVVIAMYALTNLAEVYRLTLQGAFVRELSMSKLDAANSKEALQFTALLDYEQASHQLSAGKTLASAAAPKSKVLHASNFRLNIGGLEAATQRAAALEGLGFKLQIAEEAAGERFKTAQLTGISISEITGKIAFDGLGPMYQWLFDTQFGGKPGSARPGMVEVFGVDGTTAFTIDLFDVYPLAVNPPFEAASAEKVASTEFRLKARDIRFNLKNLGT